MTHDTVGSLSRLCCLTICEEQNVYHPIPLKVYWNDIGGNATVKEKLKQAIEWPLKHPEVNVYIEKVQIWDSQ